MVLYAFVDTAVFVRGTIGEPNLKVVFENPPSTQRTVRVRLLAGSGLDTGQSLTATVQPGQAEVSFSVGDWLDAIYDSAGLVPGLYMLLVEDVEDGQATVVPLFVSELTVTPPVPTTDKLRKYIIVDKLTGAMYTLPPSIDEIPADDNFLLYAYYHDAEKRLGRLVHFNWIEVLADTGWHRAVLLSAKFRFADMCALARYMLAHTTGVPQTIQKALVAEIRAGNCYNVVRMLRTVYWGGFGIGYMWKIATYIEGQDAVLEHINYVPLGFLDSIEKYIKAGAAGCIAGVALAGLATVASAGTLGFSLALAGKACVAGAIAGVSLKVILADDGGTAKEQIVVVAGGIKKEAAEARELNTRYYNDAKDFFNNYLVPKYNISSADADQFNRLLDQWHSDIDASLKDIEENADRLLKLANQLKEAEKSRLLYAAGGGLLGALLGAAISK